MSKRELIDQIRQTGSDKYDTNRKQLFDGFYKKHRVEFFGTFVPNNSFGSSLQRLKSEFADKSQRDRAQRVVPDIAIIYNADSCIMIKNVYEGMEASDCFRFKTNPLDALRGVQAI